MACIYVYDGHGLQIRAIEVHIRAIELHIRAIELHIRAIVY
ncbi:hypothetical protein ACRASX_07595 [Flavobacterium sp. TMP13]